MSPAKMFAYMKERESKKEQLEAHSISRRDLFGDGESVYEHQQQKLKVWFPICSFFLMSRRDVKIMNLIFHR